MPNSTSRDRVKDNRMRRDSTSWQTNLASRVNWKLTLTWTLTWSRSEDLETAAAAVDSRFPLKSAATSRMIMLLGPPSSRMWINRFVESTFRNLNKSLKILNYLEKRRSSFTNKDSHMFDFLMVKILI
uniref:Uncharacterized protein n=1 Tax=Lactuca sativa TaxID=4236 RepID=A0A9R1UGH2_LACSA|nr:hypothetical protein LSAT_V11C900484450 [Lactuca sativa]